MLQEQGGSGGVERARDLLDTARKIAVDRGYALVERRADEELSKLA